MKISIVLHLRWASTLNPPIQTPDKEPKMSSYFSNAQQL